MLSRKEYPLSSSDLALIKRSWRCSRVDCVSLSSLFEKAGSIRLTERAVLFDPGQNPEVVYLVLSGFVGLLMSDGHGGKTLVKIVGPGHFVGETQILTGRAEHFSACALTNGHVAGVPKKNIRHAMESTPCFRRLFFSTLSESMRESVSLFSQLKLMNTAQRLAAYLLGIACVKSGPVRLDISFEMKALAEMLGMQPESLSRSFQKLAEFGVSRQEKNVVAIDAVERLLTFCEASSTPSPSPDQADTDGEKPGKISRQGSACCALSTLPLSVAAFSVLPESEILSVLSNAKVVTYDRTMELFHAGSRADRCFVVISGKVRLFVINGDGRETNICLVEAGESFAEAAMFGTGCYPVNAEVQFGTKLLHIPKESLFGPGHTTPSFTQALLEALGRRQRQLFEWIMEVKTRTPTERLVRELLNLTSAENGPVTVHLRISKAKLASHLGVTAETVSRIFQRLRKAGVKSDSGSKVQIDDIAVLKSFLQTLAMKRTVRSPSPASAPDG